MMNKTTFYRRYAMFLVISPNANTESIDKIINDLQLQLEGVGGSLEKYENLGIKPLGYSIAKHNTGLLLQAYLKLPDVRRSDLTTVLKPKQLAGLARYINDLYVNFDYKRNPNILRSMIVTAPHEQFNFQTLRQFSGFQYSDLK